MNRRTAQLSARYADTTHCGRIRRAAADLRPPASTLWELLNRWIRVVISFRTGVQSIRRHRSLHRQQTGHLEHAALYRPGEHSLRQEGISELQPEPVEQRTLSQSAAPGHGD